MINLIAWVILGLIAGALAKAIYPGRQGGGFLATTGLGILGALVGGYLGGMLLGTTGGALSATLSIPSIAFSVVGALIVIFIYNMVTRNA